MRCPHAAMVLLTLLAIAAEAAPAADVEFNRDVRPILANHCFQCHGPDAAQRQAELRLDREEDAFAKRDRPAIVRGDAAASEVVRRIASSDADERMPPAEANKPLSAEQIDILKRWVEQGAGWQKHWSLIPPARPPLPASTGAAHNAIDLFILAELAKQDLRPSEAAPKHTVLRRASFDLTGLPPTHEELDAFESDASPDAYERAVDRLLASTRYGERMAIRWLEAARYADTHGYQNDGERQMWRWRDWVIEGFNRNMPFDQFTIEQLAGDLLPNATLEQKIATGFNRNHRGNAEGGIIPEEYAVEYVVDRVETTSTVWLGLTMGCVRCHDHKFDPFTMDDFYSLYAFFNNVPEKGRAIKFGNSPPYIKAPTYLQKLEFHEKIRPEYEQAKAAHKALASEARELFTRWVEEYKPSGEEDYCPTEGLVARFNFDGADDSATDDRRLQWTVQDGQPIRCDSPRGSALQFDGNTVLNAGNVGDFKLFDRFTLSAWVYVEEAGGGTIISRMTDVEQGDGYHLAVVEGKLQLNIVKRWLDDSLRVESQERIPRGEWCHVAASYPGFRGDKLEHAVKLYVNGIVQETNVLLSELNQPFDTKEPLRIGGGGGPAMRFRGRIDDVHVFAGELNQTGILILSARDNIAGILAKHKLNWGPADMAKATAYYIHHHAPPAILENQRRYEKAQQALYDLNASAPTVMIMEEMSPPRKTFLLKRGQYDQPGEEVERNTPAALPPVDQSLPKDRLGFAQWLVDPDHPLTSRVTVNRLWQQFFGIGLVKTTEDFGSQGEWPTHPELLDWLAVEFSEGPGARGLGLGCGGTGLAPSPQSLAPSAAWDLKRLCRLIVTSATYRQSSAVTSQSLQLDPDNRWLSRAPRQRLSAEMVRDQALAVSGLLVEELGGPSVKPYQPAGLWSELTGGDDYVQDHGEDLYRRSLYTYWKRTIAPPTMLTFDAATREFCTVRQTRTNTPLQALTLLNETGFVEASRKLAERAMREGGTGDGERLSWLFRTVTSRRPAAGELQILEQGLNRHREHYRANPDAAKEVLTTGESPADEQLAADELAAFTAMAGLVLNLDEAINKE